MPAKMDEYFMHFHAAAKWQGLIRRPLAAARPLRFNLNIPSATTTFDSPKHWNMRRQEGEGGGRVGGPSNGEYLHLEINRTARSGS